MKLVLVGWISALVSFGIGFALGRRARRREMMRDAMFNAAATLATYKMLERGEFPKANEEDREP